MISFLAQSFIKPQVLTTNFRLTKKLGITVFGLFSTLQVIYNIGGFYWENNFFVQQDFFVQIFIDSALEILVKFFVFIIMTIFLWKSTINKESNNISNFFRYFYIVLFFSIIDLFVLPIDMFLSVCLSELIYDYISLGILICYLGFVFFMSSKAINNEISIFKVLIIFFAFIFCILFTFLLLPILLLWANG